MQIRLPAATFFLLATAFSTVHALADEPRPQKNGDERAISGQAVDEANPADKSRLVGRVAFKDQPAKPLAGATIYIFRDGNAGKRYPHPKTDEKGYFICDRPQEACIAYVHTEDNSHAAIERITADQKRLELLLQPTSHAVGRLVSADTGKAMTGEQIDYGVRIWTGKPGQSGFRTLFGGTARTAQDGTFELTGLLPAFKYDLNLLISGGPNFGDRVWRTIGHVELDQTGTIDLGDWTLTDLRDRIRTTTFLDQIKLSFALDGDVSERINSKLRDANLSRRNLIAVVAPWRHSCCQQFFEAMTAFGTPAKGKFNEAVAPFELLAVTPDQLELTPGLPGSFPDLVPAIKDRNSFTLAVFSPTGKLLTSIDQKSLTIDGNLDLKKMYALLGKHTPELPDAKQLIDAAFDQAKREHKKVLLQHSETLCSPCTLLSRYFDNHRALIEKDYVWVTIDPRFKHGREIIDHYRPQPGGIPWFAIIAPDGKTLATSDSKQGNIGYPASDPGRKHFESILRKTATHLTDADIATLLNDLED